MFLKVCFSDGAGRAGEGKEWGGLGRGLRGIQGSEEGVVEGTGQGREEPSGAGAVEGGTGSWGIRLP